jgi:uncharacterized cupredoxin-like copper-binding protein
VTRRTAVAPLGLAVLGLALLVIAGVVAGAGASGPVAVSIRIHYSQFEPDHVTVPAGQPVTFLIRNDDPIEHEWIVGDAAVHAVHRLGTEAHHASRPTEVSIPPLATVHTTVTFAEPVSWQFICHLPGHEAYGMVGLVEAR